MRTPRLASSSFSSLSALRPAPASLRALSLVSATLLAQHALGARALAICRVVEPSVDSGMEGVAFDQTTSALFVASPAVIVDWRCPTPDAGPDVDAGIDPDAAADLDADALVPDAAVDLDAAALDADAATITLSDAGPPRDPDLPPLCPDGSTATAVIGPVVSLVVQPRVLERAGDAGLVMPVPARPDLAQGPGDMFQSLRASTSTEAQIHETVTVIEDGSLGLQCTDPHYVVDATDVMLAAPAALWGCSAEGYYRPGTSSRDVGVTYYGDSSVREESIPVSDEYDAVALSASDSFALSAWLDEHQFAHSEVDDAAFAAYVGPERWFVAVHVHPRPPTGTTSTSTNLQPLVVSWQGSELPITNRLQFDPRGGTLVTDAFVLAPERRDAADGSAVTISAALAPSDPMLAGFGLTHGWLTHLSLARTQSMDVPDSALVPSSAGAVSVAPIERATTVRIPQACCPGGSAADRSVARTFVHERTYAASGPAPAIPEEWLHTTLDASVSVCANGGYGGCGSSGSSSSSSGSSGSSRGGRSLRGCSTSGSRLPTFTPLALAIAWLWLRGRRR